MSTDFTPPQDQQPEPPVEEPTSPWAPLEERGFNPSQYAPDEVLNGANFWKAFNHRDYRDAAMGQVMRAYGFPEDMSPRDIKQFIDEARQQPDPWQQVMGEPQYEMDQYGQPVAPQQPYFDPNSIREATRAEMQAQLDAFRREQQQAQQQQALEAEFTREIDRVAGQHDFGAEEKLWLAADATQLRQSMPYATTAEVLDKAGERINAAITRRLHALSQRQGDTPAPPLPNGPLPSDQQVPQNIEQARDAARRFFSN